MPTLGSMASLIRSKNAGPFTLTFDVMFDDPATYAAVKAKEVITVALISRVYGVPAEHIRVIEYDPGLAIKVTIPRPVTSGDPLDTDIYGAQQHAPLVDLDVPD